MPGEPRTETYRAFARVYDRVMGDRWFPTIHRSFVWAIRTYAIRFRSLADLGCGTGTFLSQVARPDVVTYGIDRAPAMVKAAAAKTRGTGARFFVQDMSDFTLPTKVDLITCNFDTLNYVLSAADLQRVFTRCRVNLNSGGHLLFDMIVPPAAHRERRSVVQEFRFPGVVSRWITSWSTQARASIVRMYYTFRGRRGEVRRAREVHVQRG